MRNKSRKCKRCGVDISDVVRHRKICVECRLKMIAGRRPPCDYKRQLIGQEDPANVARWSVILDKVKTRSLDECSILYALRG